MNHLKILLSSALIAIMGLSLSACNDRELAFGAGVVIGVIIGDDGHHHHHRPRPPRYRDRRHYAIQDLSQLSASERVSVKYGLSQDQADILTTHLLQAKAGDLTAMAELGFEKQDMVALFQGQNPSVSTLRTLGEKLGLDIQQAHELVQNIKSDVLIARDTLM